MLSSMKNKLYMYSILTAFCLFGNLGGSPVITMFMKPYMAIANQDDADRLSEKLKKPGKIAKMNIKALSRSPLVKGILSTYAGYVAMSDYDGQTSFPKKLVLPLLYLLITNKITPVLMAGNTIHHWEIAAPAQMYKVERLHNDTEDLYYWNIQEVPLPEDNRIPLEAITIIAKPDRIYVPQGITLTDNNTNFLLPTIFVKKGINTNASALYMLNVRQFFGHTHPTYKKGTSRYLSHTT